MEIHVKTDLDIVAGCSEQLESQTLHVTSAPDEQHHC